MIRIFRDLYLPDRFFVAMGIVAGLFAFSFAVPWLYPSAQAGFVLILATTIADGILIFNNKLTIDCHRKAPRILSLGDQQDIVIALKNNYPLPLRLTMIDEIPDQFQERDFTLRLFLKGHDDRQVSYPLRPLTRGAYTFHRIHLYIRSAIGLLERRLSYPLDQTIAVYPSIIQMKKYELKGIQHIAHYQGLKKIRRLGHSYEFEQIKNYVKGDDFRSINWKATGRRASLMVNQYEDERAQQVYCLIDKSRSMNLPFKGLSLLDYAINSSLVISNIALQKHDKAGLLTFAEKIDQMIIADRKRHQLHRLLECLYNQEESSLEANYEMVFQTVKRKIPHRSLLLLFTNFESAYAMQRNLSLLRKLNQLHLLVVIFFENDEVRAFSEQGSKKVEDIYYQTIAEKFMAEKTQIVHLLKQHRIQTILTKPQDLSIHVVNKYLELKARQFI